MFYKQNSCFQQIIQTERTSTQVAWPPSRHLGPAFLTGSGLALTGEGQSKLMQECTCAPGIIFSAVDSGFPLL